MTPIRAAYLKNDEFQRHMRDKVLIPQFYEARWPGRYRCLTSQGLDLAAQKANGIDTIVTQADGSEIWIEEKIVRFPRSGVAYTAFCLETKSTTEGSTKTEGWMCYDAAHFLLYCFAQADDGLVCFLIPFPPLKAWFWKREKTFPVWVAEEPGGKSIGRLVQIKDVIKHVPGVKAITLGPAL